jgi:DNA repair exonuclease SbcCD nuclease subunit
MFKFAELCIDRKIPYATIFGNHDDEGDLSRQDLMDVITELPYSVSKPGIKEVDGIGNYVVLVEHPR